MSADASGFEVKGWCPGALRPMESGDGLIVRIRPRAASLGLAEMRGIAGAAERHGNGHIDLTRRANLQIRGVSEATLGPLLDALGGLGLLDETAGAEGVRNILVSPLAGVDPSEILDMRPLASALADMLAAQPETWALPGKFTFVLDGGGGALPLSGERADLRLLAIRTIAETLIVIGIARDGWTEWLGAVEVDGCVTNAVRALLQLFLASMAESSIRLSDEAIVDFRSGLESPLRPAIPPAQQRAMGSAPLGPLDLGRSSAVLGLGVPFGSLEAAQFRGLADLIDAAGGEGIRLSPWRAFYIPLRDEAALGGLAERARSLGFVVETGHPLMRIQACPGRPACRAAYAATRADARRIAAWMAAMDFPGTAHLSGCAKGCASSAPAGLMLMGVPGGYRFLRDVTARAEGGVFLSPADIAEGRFHG